MGELPHDARRWFIGPAVAEERCDRYPLDARTDVGVEFRNGEILELKTRLETGPLVELTGGFAALLERWRKWTLADRVSPVQIGGPSCDVEIVAVRSAGTTAWSLAVAAHGPQSSRLAAIRAAWQALLLAGAPTVQQVGLHRGESMGYPEWLGRRCR
jgi:hypothetical protein